MSTLLSFLLTTVIVVVLLYTFRVQVGMAIGRLFSEPPALKKLPEGITIIRDIVFKETPQGSLCLDIYRPVAKTEQTLPVVLWLYGGGWVMGNKNQIRMMKAHHLAQHGYAVVAINYRLAPAAIFPAQIQDVKSAIRWLRSHAADYGLNADAIGVWGGSAGGHLAALAATSADVVSLNDAKDDASVSCAVQAAVDFFGPTDMSQVDAYLNAIPSHFSPQFIGGPLTENLQQVQAANPITYIDDNTSPFLIVHGKRDSVVPHQQSELLHDALCKAGISAELCLFEKGGHGIGKDFKSQALFDKVRLFFDSHLKAQ